MSANTGIPLKTSAAVAEAAMVYGETMTSSPGCTPAAPTAAYNPLVQELTEMPCLTPQMLAHVFSKA